MGGPLLNAHDNILDLLQLVSLNNDVSEKDTFVWQISLSGEFLVKSAFQAINSCVDDEPNVYWEKIWKVKTYERSLLFLWKVYHERLMTNDYKARYGAGYIASCSMCGSATENILHILRDYNASYTI